MTVDRADGEAALIDRVLAAADRLVAGSIRGHAAAGMLESRAQADRVRTLAADAARHEAAIAAAAARLDADREELRRHLESWRRQLGPADADWTHAFWRDPAWKASRSPAFLRFGELSLDHDGDALRAPALVRFPADGGILFRAPRVGRAAGIAAAQSVALRALAASPGGSVRLVLLDPAGSGENVASFMHLVDRRKELVSGRAWVEGGDIERQLEDVQCHMQMVIRTYLRGRYATLEDYTRSEGPIAEPSPVVVAVDFPAAFTADAVQRMSSIVRTGRRCGVFVVITAERDGPLPRGVELEDLARELVVVDGDDEGFRWSPPRATPPRTERVTLDAAPPPHTFRAILEAAGDDARVRAPARVPLERLLPAEWWSENSADGLHAPVGVLGSGTPLAVTLGRGPAQHALVAGRAGAGRSTVLQALLLSLATRYSPAELELYLVGFGTGGELGPWANRAHPLPHARVLAAGSERELCASVLHALGRELSRRAHLLGAAGVARFGELRRLGHELPRTLLLVDEFHAMFDPADPLAREIGALLERILRHGPRVGMHAVLGSHAPSDRLLPRAILDHLSVRITLQCGADDAEAVLGREHPMARLLERPGDALHRVVGAGGDEVQRFHVCWSDDEDRDRLLRRLLERAATMQLPRPVVFAGDEVARLDDDPDHPLASLGPAPNPAAAQLWLGASTSIDPPVAVALSRSRGRNLLLVTRDAAAASGMIGACMLSLAGQFAPGAWRVTYVDFVPPDADGALAATPARLPEMLPEGSAERVAPADLVRALRELAQLVARRREGSGDGTPVFLVLAGVQRARMLRLEEGERALARVGDEPPHASELLAAILRDGPEVGVHVVAWVDSASALQYLLHPRTLSEFGCRVVMAMPEAHSRELVGCPDAAQLGERSALLWNDEILGTVVKLRPYALPAERWMREFIASRATIAGQASTGRSP